MKFLLLGICGAALACLLAASAATADRASRTHVRGTLHATVSKDWDTVARTTQDGCPASVHSVGKRVVKLRSTRPTDVLVSFDGSRVTYLPSAVRSVRVEVVESGEQTTKSLAPCAEHVDYVRCARSKTRVDGATFRFYRSGRIEISFRRARLPEPAAACPRESAT